MLHAKGCQAIARAMNMGLIIIAALLWFILPVVFTVGFFLWWRRLRHWSFAVLGSATLLAVLAQVISFLAHNISRFGKTSGEVATTPDIPALVHASFILYVGIGVLLLVGAFGLVSAARDDLLLDDAKKK